MTRTILVVCWGNIFRSPVAEVLINQKISEIGLSENVHCISRGIQGQKGIPAPKYLRFPKYTTEYDLAIPILEKYGVNIDDHISKPIDEEIIQDADLIIALGDKIMNDKQGGLATYGEEVRQKTIIHEVLDPAEEKITNKYELIVPEIISAVEGFIPDIKKLVEQHEMGIELNRSHKRTKENE